MSFGIDKAMRRKGQIVGADPGRHSGLRGVTQDLSRRLVHGATIELLTEALHKLVALCYEHDRAGFVNICGVTGRLLIPAPMGRSGRAQWGLYPSEGIALGIILRERQAAGVALFVYDRSRRAWLVNLKDFHNRRTALTYLKSFPISVEEFRLAHAQAVG